MLSEDGSVATDYVDDVLRDQATPLFQVYLSEMQVDCGVIEAIKVRGYRPGAW